MAVPTKRTAALAVLAASALALSACKTTNKPTPASFNAEQKARVNDTLQTTANNVSDRLDELVRIEKARTKPAKDPVNTDRLPKELTRRAEVNWAGSGHALIKRLAQNIGYDFVVQGDPPPTPITVEVAKDNARVVRIFENAGMQMMPTATVAVDPEAKKVFLRYDNANQNTGTTRGGYEG